MRIALSTKRLSVYIRVQKGISYTIYLLFALGSLPFISCTFTLHEPCKYFRDVIKVDVRNARIEANKKRCCS